MTVVASDTQIMRGINAAAIIAALKKTDSASVAQLARSVGLSRQAVTRSLNGLEAAGLVRISGPTPTAVRAGRPPQLVEFNHTAGHLIAISLSPGRIRTAVGDLRGRIQAQSDVEVDLTADVAARVADAALAQLTSAGVAAEDVWAAVVSVPGIVDPGDGTVKLSASMPQVQGLDLRSELSRHFTCEIFIDNEVKLATEGERWKAPTADLSSMVLIEWGERIGAGLVLNGSLYRGVSNDSGDLGFLDLCVEFPTSPGDTGELGPFELATGAAAIVQLALHNATAAGDARLASALAALDPAGGLDLVIDACLEGNPSALAALSTGVRRFARGVAAFRALLDPEVVVIGGQMARCGTLLLELLQDALSAQILNQPRLALSRLGRDAVIYGALHHGLELVDRTRLAPFVLADSTNISKISP